MSDLFLLMVFMVILLSGVLFVGSIIWSVTGGSRRNHPRQRTMMGNDATGFPHHDDGSSWANHSSGSSDGPGDSGSSDSGGSGGGGGD